LRPCIGSVLDQKDVDLELVVADNANTDETGAVLAEFAGDRRLRIVRHTTVQSVTDNWMSALEASRGDYLVMIGDDDCLLPQYFDSIARLIERYDRPDCIAYNGYSYVFPGAIGTGARSYYADPHFHFEARLAEGELPPEYRRKVLTDMFRFLVRYPLNLQLTTFSREAVSRVPAPFFRQPFPDHFAINSLLLKARTVVYAPMKLVVIGVSPKSFGHFVYGGDQSHGMTYLGSTSRFGGKLEGNELLNSMYDWLELLRRAYPPELGGVTVDRGAYIRRQVAYWLLQYRHQAISSAELRRRVRKLTFGDWWLLFGTPLDAASWGRLRRLSSLLSKDPARGQWPGLRPLPGVSGIREFVAWLGADDANSHPARPPSGSG
jgi:glycosyltransferase involved in cell wall biosynthesis